MLSMENVTKNFGDSAVLNELNVTINEGDFVFLRGSSGSGKSTLLKLLYQDVRGFDGVINVDGTSLKEIQTYKLRRIIGTIFQSFEILERKTALENVMLAGEVLGRKEEEIRHEAISLLDKVGLRGKEERFPSQLSGGEQQRVAIARALLNKPKILLADEPTGNLDPETAESIMKLLMEINQKEQITMLVVTHSENLTQLFDSRVLFMDKGRVVEG